MLDAERADRRLVIGVVVVGVAVVVARRHWRHREQPGAGDRGRQRRLAVVGDVLGLQVEQREQHLGLLADAEAEARRHAEALDVLRVAVGARVLAERGDAERARLAGAHVDVRLEALLVERAERQPDFLQRHQAGDLGDLVDDAAGRAAAEHQRRRPLEYLDRLGGEQVAVVLADVADAVEEQVAAGREAAQVEDLVGLRAAFRGRVADARHVAQRIRTAASRSASGSAPREPC